MCAACSHKILWTKELVPYYFSSISSKTVVISNYSSFISSIYICHMAVHTVSPFNASSSIYTYTRLLDCTYLTMPRLHIFRIYYLNSWVSIVHEGHQRSRCAFSVMHQIVSFVGIGGIWDYMRLVHFNICCVWCTHNTAMVAPMTFPLIMWAKKISIDFFDPANEEPVSGHERDTSPPHRAAITCYNLAKVWAPEGRASCQPILKQAQS
jgi:hypothetical protein